LFQALLKRALLDILHLQQRCLRLSAALGKCSACSPIIASEFPFLSAGIAIPAVKNQRIRLPEIDVLSSIKHNAGKPSLGRAPEPAFSLSISIINGVRQHLPGRPARRPIQRCMAADSANLVEFPQKP
jgi:hypothetical protein